MEYSTPGFPSLSPRACSNSCSLNRWCHPTTSSSVAPFSSCLQSFPASGSFPMIWLFASSGQRIGASVSASVLPMNIQGQFPLGWSGWSSLQSKGLSRVFSSTTVWKHQFQILSRAHRSRPLIGFLPPPPAPPLLLVSRTSHALFCFTRHTPAFWALGSLTFMVLPLAHSSESS